MRGKGLMREAMEGRMLGMRSGKATNLLPNILGMFDELFENMEQ